MAKPYGLANQKLCYVQIQLNIEKSGEKDSERCLQWLVNKEPGAHFTESVHLRDLFGNVYIDIYEIYFSQMYNLA